MRQTLLESRFEHIFDLIFSYDVKKSEEGKRLLMTVRSGDALHDLARYAYEKDFKTKFMVIKHLGNFNDKEIVDDLVTFLQDESETIRSITEFELNRINTEEKYDRLLDVIEDAPKKVRLYAIKSLGAAEQTNAVLPLINMIEDEDPDVRTQIVDSLRLIGDHRAEEPVMSKLNDPEAEVRFAAAFFCGSHRVKKAAPDLFGMLSDKSPRVRATAVWAMGKIRDMYWILKLKDVLNKEKDINVRNEIFRVMYSVGVHKVLGKNESELLYCEEDNCTRAVSDWLVTYVSSQKKVEHADICLFLEGTYPYVKGGVSSWVDGLLNYFYDLKFSIIYLGASSSELREFQHRVPKNVIYFGETYLYDMPEENPDRLIDPQSNAVFMDRIFEIINRISTQDYKRFEKQVREMGILDGKAPDFNDMVTTRQAWDLVLKLYQKFTPELPFLDYIWSYRSMLLPIYKTITRKMPPASLYYSPLTGFSGLAAVMAKLKYQKPLIITEHGIYHRERMMEINRANWIHETRQDGFVVKEVISGLKKVWINIYLHLSKLAYAFADRITTLNSDNSRMQKEAGADPEKLMIIPNGIDPKRFAHIDKSGFAQKTELTVGLVGRVVSVKDVKTFIWAANIINEQTEGKVKFLVMGSYDEEPEYAAECFALKSLLGLDGVMEFTGNVELEKYYENLDVMVLTSITEGQPLSLMEAMAAGIPCVTTNVGSCRELLYGKPGEDKEMGKCGIVTNVHSPHETAAAIMKILTDPYKYKKMSKIARDRIYKYYRLDDIFAQYRALFETYLKKQEQE